MAAHVIDEQLRYDIFWVMKWNTLPTGCKVAVMEVAIGANLEVASTAEGRWLNLGIWVTEV